MTKDERRSQLLDVAAESIRGDGASQLTMERLAERAGVSKALPYNHFTSIDHVMVSLYEREAVRLGTFIWESLEAASPTADLCRVHISAYFEGVRRAGHVFGALTVPGSPVVAHPGRSDAGPRFSSRLLHRFHGVERDKAGVLGSIVHATALGASNAWRKRLASRAELEDLAVHQLRAAITWAGGRS